LAAEYNGPPSEHYDATDAILSIPEIRDALKMLRAVQRDVLNAPPSTAAPPNQ
jgi:hypothetical protein